MLGALVTDINALLTSTGYVIIALRSHERLDRGDNFFYTLVNAAANPYTRSTVEIAGKFGLKKVTDSLGVQLKLVLDRNPKIRYMSRGRARYFTEEDYEYITTELLKIHKPLPTGGRVVAKQEKAGKVELAEEEDPWIEIRRGLARIGTEEDILANGIPAAGELSPGHKRNRDRYRQERQYGENMKSKYSEVALGLTSTALNIILTGARVLPEDIIERAKTLAGEIEIGDLMKAEDGKTRERQSVVLDFFWREMVEPIIKDRWGNGSPKGTGEIRIARTIGAIEQRINTKTGRRYSREEVSTELRPTFFPLEKQEEIQPHA